MSVQLILKNSAVQDKEATAAQLAVGEIALNYYESGPFLQCKDTNGDVWRLGGVVIAGTAPSSPSQGAWWLDSDTDQMFFYDGSAWKELFVLDSNGTATFDNNVVIEGNLTVNGTTTTIDSETLLVKDKNIEMAVVDSPTDATADGGGITLKGTTDKTINWVNATDAWTSSERFDFPAGTAAAPSIILNGDVNSGIYQPGADQVAISTGGSGRLFVDGSGNTGVGGSPTATSKLYVHGQLGTQAAKLYLLSNQTYLESYNYNLNFGSFLAGGIGGNIIFNTGVGSATERLRITSDGKVGVGTSSPVAMLHITASSGGAGSGLRITRSDTGGGDWRIWSTADVNGEGGGKLIFGNTGNRVTIDSAGNVGIGTTSPGSALDVGGAGSTAASFVTNPKLGIAGDVFFEPGSGNDVQIFNYRTTGLAFGVGGAEKARIDSSGRLLVGTTTAPTVGISNDALFVVQGYEGSPTGDSLISLQRGQAPASISSGAQLGSIAFGASDGSPYAQIHAATDGTGGTNDYPGRLVFSTTADSGSAPTERMRIDRSGHVGIGTINPGYRLEVESSADDIARFAGTNAGSIIFRNATNNEVMLHTGSFDAFIFGTHGNNERLRIDYTGRVGIGTSAPVKKLQVSAGVSGDAGNLLLVNTNDANGDTASILFSTTNNDAYNKVGIFYERTDTQARGSLHLCTDNTNDSSNVEKTDARLSITAAGNVGIGTTSPSSSLQINAAASTTNGAFRITDDATESLRANVVASNTSGIWASGSLALGTGSNTFTERARIDSSGRLLVGTSTARGDFFNANTVFPVFQVQGTGNNRIASITAVDTTSSSGASLCLAKSRSAGNTIVQNSDTFGSINFHGSDGSELVEAASIKAVVDGTPGANDMPGRLVFSTTADGASSPTEHLRINQAGAVKMSTNGSFTNASSTVHEAFQSNSANGLYIRCTNGSYTDTGLAIDIDRNTTNSTYNFIQASCTGVAARFIVRDSGNVLNANNSYTGISDIKLKENIVNANSQWDDLKALQVRSYNFKEETGQPTHRQIGLIAQEVESICPGLVDEAADRDGEGNDLGTVTKSVNYSVLYMKAVKALQEAMERIETLEQRLNDAGIA